MDKTVAVFHEDGDKVLLEVNVQETEFILEPEVNVNPVVANSNDNVVQCDSENEEETNDHELGMEDEGEVQIAPIDKEETKRQEEAEMQKFVDFMRKQGLVVVDLAQQQQLQGQQRVQEQNPQQKTGKGVGRSTTTAKSVPERADMNRRSILDKGRSIETDFVDSGSVVTIYQNVVQQAINEPRVEANKRDSSSSDEPFDVSDESGRLQSEINTSHEINRFISDVRRLSTEQSNVADMAQAHCSKDDPPPQRSVEPRQQPQLSKAEVMIHDAEAVKARIYEVPGTSGVVNNDRTPEHVHDMKLTTSPSNRPSYLADEDYLIVGNHIDEALKRKIGNGEYVDFAKLMPKDRVGVDDDNRMEMVNRGGMSFWVPVSEREVTSISNFIKWEQAFRVYMNIYTFFHLTRAGELIQYNHIIHTAAQSFSWENVYRYDREFRLHMSRHHLHRNWGVILQQAWSMCLKDKIFHSSPAYNAGGGRGSHAGQNGGGGSGPRRKLCFDFNRGNCTFGKKCKFDHRCSFCHKYGHGSFCCRRALGRTNGNQDNANNANRWDRYEKDQSRQNQNSSEKKH